MENCGINNIVLRNKTQLSNYMFQMRTAQKTDMELAKPELLKKIKNKTLCRLDIAYILLERSCRYYKQLKTGQKLKHFYSGLEGNL